MGSRGIDIAWDRPTTGQILATGAQWVARYFSNDPTKNLRADEVTAYRAAGLGIVTVFESTAARAEQGFAAGQADARTAEQQRAAVGLPATHIHHFAVDTDTDWASVAPYFDGVASVIGKARSGVYGGLRVITGAHQAGLRYLWQTIGWSGGVWSPYATIRQPGGTVLQGQADVDEAMVTDFGQYPRPAAPTPTTPPEDTVFATTIAPGFGADVTGKIADPTRGTIIAIPPQNGTFWAGVFVSFGSDFGVAHLRVAIGDAHGQWRVQLIAVDSAAPRVNIAIKDGDQKVSILRVPATPADKADSIPVSCLVEAFRK